MNAQRLDDFSSSLLELFRVEVENQTALLTTVLLEMERAPASPQQFEILLRALHSVKGAARIINFQAAARTAHAMEDAFAAAQGGRLKLGQAEIDLLLRGVDLLLQFSSGTSSDVAAREDAHAAA